MQVQSHEEEVTNATAGGGKVNAARTADTAAFFDILSKNLYSQPRIAAMREVICNAWDAHIQSGKRDVPIEVTYVDGTFTVKDYGTGIPHDKMHDIYLVYGGSTKTQDSAQTGGFGLGCKAPFAVTDTFTVTNCHDGVKVVYSVQRHCAEVGGIPGIKEMVRVPTTESGITVQFPINSVEHEIGKLLDNGKIHAVLNGTTYNSGEVPHWWEHTENDRRLHIRYGSVLYPYPVRDRGSKEYPKGMYHVIDTTGLGFIVEAEPDSLVIAPSRENILLNDENLAYLHKRVEDALKDWKSRFNDYEAEYLRCIHKYLDACKADTGMRDSCICGLVSVKYSTCTRYDDNTYYWNRRHTVLGMRTIMPLHIKAWHSYATTAEDYNKKQQINDLFWDTLHARRAEFIPADVLKRMDKDGKRFAYKYQQRVERLFDKAKSSERAHVISITNTVRVGTLKKDVGNITAVQLKDKEDFDDLKKKLRFSGHIGGIEFYEAPVRPKQVRKPRDPNAPKNMISAWSSTRFGVRTFENVELNTLREHPAAEIKWNPNPKYFVQTDGRTISACLDESYHDNASSMKSIAEVLGVSLSEIGITKRFTRDHSRKFEVLKLIQDKPYAGMVTFFIRYHEADIWRFLNAHRDILTALGLPEDSMDDAHTKLYDATSRTLGLFGARSTFRYNTPLPKNVEHKFEEVRGILRNIPFDSMDQTIVSNFIKEVIKCN